MPPVTIIRRWETLREHRWIAAVAVGCLAFTTGVALLMRLGVATWSITMARDLGRDRGEVSHIVAAAGTAPAAGHTAFEGLDRALGEVPRSRIERRSVVIDITRRQHAVTLLGVAASLPVLQPVAMQSGRWFTPREERGAHPVVVIGEELVDSVFRGAVPRRVRVADRWLEVIGVAATGPVAPVSLNEALVVPTPLIFRLVRRAAAPREMLVAVSEGLETDPERRTSVLDDTWALLERRHRFRGRLTRMNAADRLGDTARLADALREGAERLSLVLLAASLASVAALMLTIARGQSRAVGIRRALGATRAHVVTQGAWIGAGIGIAGVLVGTMAALLVVLVIHELADIPTLPFPLVLHALAQAGALPLGTCVGVGALCFARLARQSPARLLA